MSREGITAEEEEPTAIGKTKVESLTVESLYGWGGDIDDT